eukprot:Nk52_evm6s312 gene=Nk52_evmTU6s312
MVYNSKLPGALLVLAFLACLFMVSSAENIHEQPLNATASEGGLKTSPNPNDRLKNGLRVASKYRFNPPISYSFVDNEPDEKDVFEVPNVCKVPLSKLVTCFIARDKRPNFPKVISKTVKMFFSEISEGEYQLEFKDVNIEGFPKTFKSRVHREGYRRSAKTYVDEYFNEYEVYAYPAS